MFFDVKLFRRFIYSDYFCIQIQLQIYKQLFKLFPKIKINSKTTFAELIMNMTHLSVNINKIATLRNARGENNPNVVKVATDCEAFGAQGITVHPRPDERHIRRNDVYDLRAIVKTEFNIEGNPTNDFIELVLRVRPEQVTLVPDAANALTSSCGWDVEHNFDFLTEVVERFRDAGIRTSIFVDPDINTIKLAAKTGADRVELYTKPYADNYAADRDAAVAPYIEASRAAHNLGLGVNAGHDLSLENLEFFHEKVPYLSEVSIGHALICDALYLGLEETIKRYRACLAKK
jgi:pyridoxine 5-phosphate synthase